jgi:hypothetical protein
MSKNSSSSSNENNSKNKLNMKEFKSTLNSTYEVQSSSNGNGNSQNGFKYPNNYFDPNSLSYAAKQYLNQFNPANPNNSIKTQVQTNATFNLYNTNNNKTNFYKPVHEYVTIEFTNPIPPKYVSRERKPLAIVNPETKQVLNASQFSRSISASQSNPSDLKDILNKQPTKYQNQTNSINYSLGYQSTPHIGRYESSKKSYKSNVFFLLKYYLIY